MSAGKVLMATFGTILALVAVGLLIGGGALLWAVETQRDADGFFSSPTYWISAEGYALTTEAAELALHPGDWWPSAPLATVRLRVRSTGSSEVFVGIAPADPLSAYLKGVAHDEITDMGEKMEDLKTISLTGNAPATPPAEQTFWVASVQGGDEQVLDWDLEPGTWSAVIMNSDGSAKVSASVVAAGKLPVLGPIGIGLLAGGLVLAALASLLILGATRSITAAPMEQGAEALRGPYPAALQGSLDEPLSPALWLVKWFLVIPHVIVLAFLWAAFVVLSFFAWIAILFTGRYPRGIFEFNLGVMRWSWRVAFYAYSALGTDRYPPFTLEDVEYPARFDVGYPDQLSRGLVLVKWWLLAIPHYLIVGVLFSGLFYWVTDAGERVGVNPVFEIGGGLIALLVLIAGVALLFTGRYPRGLFDLVMGFNRWFFRVWAYAALMTDTYPPFRLDMGASEPGDSFLAHDADSD